MKLKTIMACGRDVYFDYQLIDDRTGKILVDRVRKIFAKYSAKPSNSKYLLPLTALPKDMPLHYLRAQYAQDLYRYFAERGTATGNMYYCRAERKGQAYDKGILLAVSQQMGHSRCDVVVSHYLY